MWSSNAFLKRCEKLKDLGLSPPLSTGMRVARGFADLGYEEFYCLSDKKLVSIFTGHLSDITPEHRNFFFAILPIEALVDSISKLHYDVESFTFVDQRRWRVALRHAGSSELLEVLDRELDCAVADALIQIAGRRA